MEDSHFLSRLERVSTPQVELLLSLYRDPGLVRHLLGCLDLPENASRVAIALEHGEDSPRVIVTRDGKFVTCLGQGMAAPNLPQVSREKLDAACARVEDFRSRMALARSLAGKDTSKLQVRLLEAGDALSREEITALCAWGPYAGAQLAQILLDISQTLEDMRSFTARRGHARGYDRKNLLTHWRFTHAIGHILTVLSIWGAQPWMHKFYELKGNRLSVFFSLGLKQEVSPTVLRALFSINRVGKLLLPAYKQDFLGQTPGAGAVDSRNAFFVLLLLGIGHARLEAEARKTLLRPPPFLTRQGETPRSRKEKFKSINDCFDDPEKLTQFQKYFGIERAMEIAQKLPEGSPYKFESPAKVPGDLALTLALHLPGDFWSERNMARCVVLLPWLARARAEDLYLPQDFLQSTYKPPSQGELLRSLESWIEVYKETPIQVEKKPGRNEPCSCGSGKKYKKCCG